MTAVVDRIWACVCGVLFAFSMNCTFYFIQIGYWANSYWGGSVACLGSALAFGSVLWFGREVDVDAAISRPLEGLLVSIPMSIGMLMLLRQYARTITVSSTLKKLALPMLVGFIGVIWLNMVLRSAELPNRHLAVGRAMRQKSGKILWKTFLFIFI